MPTAERSTTTSGASSPNHRVAVTTEAITAHGPAMVFCRTKRGADRLSDRLARSGLQSAAIHGDRSQSQRERALAAFRAGRLDVLVATDIAARGIHVDAVPLVVHFDPPAGPTDYVHRAGRTGRAGADGIVVSLVGNQHVADTKLIQKRLGLSAGISVPDVHALAPTDLTRPPTRGSAACGEAVFGRRACNPATVNGFPAHREVVEGRCAASGQAASVAIADHRIPDGMRTDERPHVSDRKWVTRDDLRPWRAVRSVADDGSRRGDVGRGLQMGRQVVIVGGVAGGMSTATRLRRLDEAADDHRDRAVRARLLRRTAASPTSWAG